MRRPVISPQQKMIQVANKVGNRGIAQQQGTTRSIYDQLPVDGRTDFKFFKDSQARSFPQSNLTGGKLSPQEMLTIQRIYFALVNVDGADPNDFLSIETLDNADANIQGGQFTIETAEQIVCKDIPLASLLSSFNKSSQFFEQVIFYMDTELTLSPQLEFKVTVSIPTPVTVADQFLRCTMEGPGSLINLKATV